jgi:hypothetical protein
VSRKCLLRKRDVGRDELRKNLGADYGHFKTTPEGSGVAVITRDVLAE